ncbi:MAG: hypothetical protein KDA54_18630 [Phycisphaerales bacterium]|nr:hypothetical protein [Phycisphaerales bacterium]
MQTFFDLLTLLASFVLAAAMLAVPINGVDHIRYRVRLKNVIRKIGLADLRIEKKRCKFGLAISYLADEGRKNTHLCRAYDRHFLLCEDEYSPTHFIYCGTDSSVEVVALTNEDIHHGGHPFYSRTFKNGVGTCLLCAIVTLIAVPYAIGKLLKWGILDRVAPLGPYVQQVAGNSAFLLKSIQIIVLAVAILCFVYLPLWAAVVTYRKLRYDAQISPYPICGACGYDLRGNDPNLCPECGTKDPVFAHPA